MGRRSRKRRDPAAPAQPRARGAARYEQMRPAPEPLEPGERPGILTLAAIVAAVVAAANVAAGLAGADLAGDRGNAIVFTIVTTAVLVVCAVGMWLVQYWAVLGFMAVLGLNAGTIGLALLGGGISGWRIVPGLLLLIAIGWLFLKLMRVVPRLEMPERPAAQRDV